MIGSAALTGMTGGVGALPVGAHVPEGAMRLWPGIPPGGGGPRGPENMRKNGAVYHIARPSLTVRMPHRATGAACLVIAGGGYRSIVLPNEADRAADWLTDRGIIACVLRYRLPGEGWTQGPNAPLQDALRAIRLMRAGKVMAQIDPDRVFVMGFSAGGHLAALAATQPDLQNYPAVDDFDMVPATLKAAVLAYPVITLRAPYNKTSSARMLIGENPTPAAIAEWSVEPHIGPHMPPSFLIQAADDPIINPENGVIFTKACVANHVPVERVLVPTGGHGFGMGKPGTASAGWGRLLQPWMRRQGLV